MRAFIRRRKPTSDGCKEWQDLSSVLLPRTHKGTCKTCRARRYKLATHVVNLDENGYVCKPTQVKTGDSKPPHDRHSIEIVFNAKSTSNTLISLIREFAKNKGTVEEPKGLLAEPKERKRLLEIVTRLVKDVKALVKGESRLLNVSSPCYGECCSLLSPVLLNPHFEILLLFYSVIGVRKFKSMLNND